MVSDSLLPLEDPEPRLYQSTTTELLCPICTLLLDRPVQLECGTIICLQSCIQFHHSPLSCPCCYVPLDSDHIRPPPPLVVTLVEALHVHCVRGCGKVVCLRQYQQQACQGHFYTQADSPSKLTISEVLSRPSALPATSAEVNVAEHLVQKIMDQSSGDSKHNPASGQIRPGYLKSAQRPTNGNEYH